MIEEILPPPAAVREALADRLLTDGLPAVNGQQLTGFAGRFLVRQGLIVTAIVIERDPCPPALFPRRQTANSRPRSNRMPFRS